MKLFRFSTFCFVLMCSGCVNDPIEWGDVSYRASQLGDPDARSAVMSAGLPAVSETAAPCVRSIRPAGDGSELFRVWWALRSDSSAVLAMQRSSDRGTTWHAATLVDARDRGRRGCDRPSPGVFYDPASGYLHLVYFIEGADGAGLFFSHSMDKGGMFHAPVPVVYGNRPSSASVVGAGDSVVVVFEDPNAATPRIGIVLSRSAGHIFEQRGQVTPDDVAARAPWVALDHDEITVWWKTPDKSGSPYGDRVGSRAGRWR